MKVKLSDVHILEERFRSDYGNIEELAVSIQRYGLFHPIVVDKEMNLIAGERRYKAHVMLGLLEIEVRMIEEADSLVKKEIEIEENLKRKDFTWQEEIKAKSEIDHIKRELYGSAIKGHGGGWSLRDTAASLGESVGLTSRDIRLADGLVEFPELRKEKSKDAAWRRLEHIRENLLMGALSERVQLRVSKDCVVCGDSAIEMEKFGDESVDLVCTDSPFGIGLKMKDNTHGGKTYDDDTQKVFNTIDRVAGECFRVLRRDRHMYWFHDPRHYSMLREIMERKGFSVLETPLIWYKTGGAGPGGSDLQWSRNYECILFCYKGHRALNKKGESDVIMLPRLAPQKKQHPTEKPTQLLRYLIEQSTVPGELVIDPFAGSGSTLIAAFECKRQGWGCEIDREYFDKIVVKVDEFASLTQLKR